MRVVIIGAGVIGLLTAMECVRAGAGVDLVDAGDIPCPQATSYDRQRVVRALHRGDPPVTRAAARAQQGWLALDRMLGAGCYHRSGSLSVMPPGDAALSRRLLAEAGLPARLLSARQLSASYPALRFPAGLAGVLETGAGIVLADRALTAAARWLRGQPAVRMFPNCPAARVTGSVVRLRDGSELPGDRVIVAAGPWSRDLLPAVAGAVILYRQSMLSYRPGPAGPGRSGWAGLPVIQRFGTSQGAWLIPPVAGAPARLSSGDSVRAVTRITGRVTPARWRDHLAGQFAGLLAGFDPAAVTGGTDGYYLAAAAGGGPLLAVLHDGAVLAYAACGGMSFKLAPLVAGALAGRVTGRPALPTGLAPVDRPFRPAAASRADRADPMEVTR
jgi:sarcosine oxidase